MASGSEREDAWKASGGAIDPAGLTRAEVDRLPGLVLLEFGASWCPYCQRLAPGLAALLQAYPEVRHIRIEDGPGLPLGRSFGVKLWPNLVFLRDGEILAKVARPTHEELTMLFQNI